MHNAWFIASLLIITAVTAQASKPTQTLRRTLSGAATPKISKLRLIDADTDLPIPGYDPITDPAVIDISTLPSPNLSVEAITEGSVGSIQWDFNGAIRNENSAVWALCGNNRTDFFPCQRLKIGTNTTIKATPYSSKGANGTRGQTVSVRMALYKTNETSRVSMSFTLVNADTDADIGPLRNDTVIDIMTTPRINIRANVEPSTMIASVQFTNNGVLYRTENETPYAYSGNKGSDYYFWSPSVGKYAILGSAFSDRDAKGALLSTELVTFTVVKSGTLTTNAPVSSPPVVTSSPTTLYDSAAPKLISLKVLTPTVDVSRGPAKGTVQITVQDDRSGIGRVGVGVNSEVGRYSYLSDLYPIDTPGNRAYTFNVTLEFEQFIRKGRYLLSVYLRDIPGWNSCYFDYRALAALNFSDSIEVLNTNEDVSPPELLAFSLIGSDVVDVTNGPANLSFNVICRDLMYGVKYVDVYASGGGRVIQKLDWLQTPLVGTSISIIQLDFPANAKSGNYSLELHLADADYNTVQLNSSQLLQRNLLSIVKVVNNNEDVTPPTLVNFTSYQYPNIVDTTSSGDGSIAFALTVLDAHSGFWYGTITATYDANRTLVLAPRYLPSPVVGEFTFHGLFKFDMGSWKGNYTLSVSFQDEARNAKTFTSQELIALGYPGFFTVV